MDSFVVYDLCSDVKSTFTVKSDLYNDEGMLKVKIRACTICHMISIGEEKNAYDEKEREKYEHLVTIGTHSVAVGNFATSINHRKGV